MVEFGHILDEKMKTMLRETKENVQGTNSDAKETETQIHGVGHKEERKSNQKRMKKQESKKIRRGLGTSRFQHPNHRVARRRRETAKI